MDGKSLVGVTQAYAASVLRNAAGHVKFMIGREKDPENSEVRLPAAAAERSAQSRDGWLVGTWAIMVALTAGLSS